MMLARLNKRNQARAAMAQLRAAPLASPEEREEIVRTPNLVLRNLKITQMYHRLSQELALLLGDEDANWCTFACNASKTAGVRHPPRGATVHRVLPSRAGVPGCAEGPTVWGRG